MFTLKINVVVFSFVNDLVVCLHVPTKATDCSNTKMQGLLGVWNLHSYVLSIYRRPGFFFECPDLTHLATIDFRHLIDRHAIKNEFYSKLCWQGDGGILAANGAPCIMVRVCEAVL